MQSVKYLAEVAITDALEKATVSPNDAIVQHLMGDPRFMALLETYHNNKRRGVGAGGVCVCVCASGGVHRSNLHITAVAVSWAVTWAVSWLSASQAMSASRASQLHPHVCSCHIMTAIYIYIYYSYTCLG